MAIQQLNTEQIEHISKTMRVVLDALIEKKLVVMGTAINTEQTVAMAIGIVLAATRVCVMTAHTADEHEQQMRRVLAYALSEVKAFVRGIKRLEQEPNTPVFITFKQHNTEYAQIIKLGRSKDVAGTARPDLREGSSDGPGHDGRVFQWTVLEDRKTRH